MKLPRLFHTLVAALPIAAAACGVSEKDRFYGLSPEENSLAAKIGNDIVPGYAVGADEAVRLRAEIVAKHPEWIAETQAAIRAGEVTTGMTRAQAAAAWGLGFLHEIRPVKYANRIRRERFWFDCSPNIAAHYFVDDTLIAVRLYDEAGRSIPMSLGPENLGYARPARTQPVQDREALHKRTWLIYPEWREPMSRRPVASDIP